MAATDDLVRYRYIERLGSGGMATVTLAEDTVLRRLVALKRVHAGGDGRAASRLRREALVGASLSHPNLVAIYDVEVGEDGDLVIVMEYVAGQTLRDAVANSGGLPPALVLNILGGLAAGLDMIHARGIVHRDVKPANVLLGREGAIKLADLGIAVADDRTRITSAGEILGTFSYMAPEQLEGDPATAAVDIYALAVVAFEMLSGQKARPQTNPVALAHAIATRPPPDLCAISAGTPPAAAEVLKRGMAADPAERPGSAGALVDQLRVALEPAAVTVSAPELAPIGRRPPETPAPPANPTPGVGGYPAGTRSRAPGTGGMPGGAGVILAGLGALGLAALVLALLNSGGGAPTKRTGVSAAAGRVTGKTSKTSRTSGTSAATGSSGASSAGGGAGGGGQVTSNPSVSTPSGAVQTFYGRAAAHDFKGAWALADPAFRAQLQGYASFAGGQSQVRSITFHEAQTTAQDGQTATVAVRTTAVLVSKTQQCQGTVQVARSASGGWLLHQISINCV